MQTNPAKRSSLLHKTSVNSASSKHAKQPTHKHKGIGKLDKNTEESRISSKQSFMSGKGDRRTQKGRSHHKQIRRTEV